MEFLKRSWVQTQAFLSQLSVTARWLIGCLLIIFLMVGWLLMQYAAEPELLPITQFAVERQPEVAAHLGRSGINVTVEAGQLHVPVEKYDQAMAILLGSDLLANDTAAAFDDMIARQSPWQSNAQNAQAFLLAKQKVLGQIVGKMAGVRSASVMLSMPEKQGFGSSYVRPTASVNVVMSGRKRVDKRLVEAIAGLVSGAVAEMVAQDVVIIDANRGRQFTVKSRDDVGPGETLELVQQLEQRYREKVTEVLSYIPGVIIAVNARVDPIRTKRIEEYDYEAAEPLKSEFSRETERENKSTAGEPGARPNTGLDIAGGNQTGNFERIVENRNDFNEKNLTRRTHTTESGHTTKQVSVTINVPRMYFVAVYKQGKPNDAEEPNDEALQPIVEQQLAQIQSQVEPLVGVDQNNGVVHAHMIPDRQNLLLLAGVSASNASPGGISGILESSWAKPAGLAVLALASLALMFGMVRKATQPPVLPSIDELAGIPAKLPGGDEDLTGEAPSADEEMMGMELSEEEVAMRRIADQIAEMIHDNPYEASQLLSRWVLSSE